MQQYLSSVAYTLCVKCCVRVCVCARVFMEVLGRFVVSAVLMLIDFSLSCCSLARIFYVFYQAELCVCVCVYACVHDVLSIIHI